MIEDRLVYLGRLLLLVLLDRQMLGIFRVHCLTDGLAIGEEVTNHYDGAVRVAYVLRVSDRNGEGADELRILEIDGQIAEPFLVLSELDFRDEPGIALQHVPHRLLAAASRDLDRAVLLSQLERLRLVVLGL